MKQFSEETRKKISEGVKKAHRDGRCGTSQFNGKRGWSKGRTIKTDKRLYKNSIISKSEDEVLIENSPHWASIRRYITIRKIDIFSCGHLKWMNKELKLALHHVNSDKKDCRKENLQLLCPNCHSLTNNFCFKSRAHSVESKQKISDAMKIWHDARVSQLAEETRLDRVR